MIKMLDVNKVIGHVNGESLDKITFVANQKNKEGIMQRITLGEMYVAIDPYTEERFLLRVSNVKYGQNAAFRTESARAYNQAIAANFQGEHLNFDKIYQDNRPGQRFIEAECEYVGYIDLEGNLDLQSICHQMTLL